MNKLWCHHEKIIVNKVTDYGMKFKHLFTKLLATFNIPTKGQNLSEYLFYKKVKYTDTNTCTDKSCFYCEYFILNGASITFQCT